MKRRTVFKHLAVASAAAWLLPTCISDPKKVSVALNRLQITPDEEELVANIADVLIPATETPGALAVGAHLFTLVMVDDCMSRKDQEKYLAGMRNFDQTVKTLTGKSFATAEAHERAKILTAFQEQLAEAGEDVKTFYSKTRGYIIQGYTMSQHFLTEVKPYQLVPGPNYDGCAPVISDSKMTS